MTQDLTGLYLYSSCGACDFGRILKNHKDDNNTDVIDIEVYDVNDLLSFGCSPEDEEERFKSYQTRAVLPEGVNIKVLNVGYILSELGDTKFIEINNNASGCFRCVKSFILKDKKSDF